MALWDQCTLINKIEIGGVQYICSSDFIRAYSIYTRGKLEDLTAKLLASVCDYDESLLQ